MRNINFRICALPASLLAMTMVANFGCSTGTGSGAGTAGTSGGSAGAVGGSAGASSGSAGASTGGTAGSSGGTAGTTGGTAGTVGGTAGTTAGGTAGTGLPTTGVCAGAGTRPLTVAQGKVDDFEADPISPGWSSFNDVQPTMNAFKIAREAGGADGTAFGGHYMGTGAKTPVMGGFGVGTLYNMAIDPTSMIYCVDITAFDGVTFWAKAGTAGSKVGVNFVIPSTNQAPDGDCPMTATTCFNHPQKVVTLTTDWQQYTVSFASALGSTGAKVGSVLQELLWLSPDSTWDFWIDEIQLYKGTAPTTPVGGNSTGM